MRTGSPLPSVTVGIMGIGNQFLLQGHASSRPENLTMRSPIEPPRPFGEASVSCPKREVEREVQYSKVSSECPVKPSECHTIRERKEHCVQARRGEGSVRELNCVNSYVCTVNLLSDSVMSEIFIRR